MSSEPETSGETAGRRSKRSSADLLRGLLGHEMRVEIVDGRIFEGIFVCLDKPVNLVLDQALESLSNNTASTPRDVGLILIPIRHIIRVQAPSKYLRDPCLFTAIELPSPDQSNT
ncbi:hypothetical protein PGT21_032200 [Puccinia graminis f. sp. tritici]|uniref:Sm domain-containing protein n=1 Tax=Puccinia graminis f. sp. tritici TaxID=56615 RepID=A0A5B0NQ47_PUCGR|nr:hypothetical protein PGTUg99_033357 [Puccinia graminis f. sp. tritici]KAA1091365.1 hypothetical protein PGT21_032200 [Puccinia graminis f. sp. tritici]